MAYAEGTSVPEARTRAELETLLHRYGADAFSYATMEGRGTAVQFRLNGKWVRMGVPVPSRADPMICQTPSGRLRTEAQIEENLAAERRRRWRSLFAVVKAKLVAVADGISSIEREFMADVVLPDGSTVSEWLTPQLESAYEAGIMPREMLALPPAPTEGEVIDIGTAKG